MDERTCLRHLVDRHDAMTMKMDCYRHACDRLRDENAALRAELAAARGLGDPRS